MFAKSLESTKFFIIKAALFQISNPGCVRVKIRIPVENKSRIKAVPKYKINLKKIFFPQKL